jgi:hypothetical protein
VSVLLNNGDGSFPTDGGPYPTYQVGDGPTSVVVVDLNGDGWPDLAVVNYADSTMSELLNNGDGTFAAKVDHPTGLEPASVAAADLNGDGMPDLATANYDDDTVTVLINTCGP